MARYLSIRVGRAVLALWGVITIAFFLLHINANPGLLLAGPTATRIQVDQINRQFGFDQGIFAQYLQYFNRVFHGNMGNSYYYQSSSFRLVLNRIPSTLELAGTAFVFGFLVALMLSIAVQILRGTRLKNALLWIGAVRQAIPTFFFAALLVLFFAIKLPWFPAIGRGGVSHLVLPAFALGTYEMTLYFRILNSSFAEQMKEDYVRTAYAKGLSRRTVVFRHMLPNALLPVLTIAGLTLGALFSGTVVVETVFEWNGLGQLFYTAINIRDYAVIQVGLIFTGGFLIALNVLVDLLYSVVDPRVRIR